MKIVHHNNIDKNLATGLDGVKSRNVDKAKGNPSKDSSVASRAELADASKLDLSERARLMSKATDIAKHTEVNNDQKIARLQKMIDEGNYKVDSQAVADRLVDHHLSFPD